MNTVYQCLCKQGVLVLLGIYVGAEFMGHVVTICLTF